MSQIIQNSVGISAPNLLAICVNNAEYGEIQGEFYHYYDKEPIGFCSILELIREMERFFDDLAFPQTSNRGRSFLEKENEIPVDIKRKEKQILWEQLMNHSGRRGTFITSVKFRQRSAWQGEFFWKEKNEKISFSSALEFIRLIDERVAQADEKEE